MINDAAPGRAAAGVGVLAPHDFALDRELWRWTPEAVTLHLTRLPAGPPAVTVEMITALGDPDDIAAATRQVTTVSPAVVVYACTSGSFVGGLAGERAIREAVRAGGAPDAVTTSGALIEALDALGAGRVALATPYTRDLTDRLGEFLSATGRSVVHRVDLSMQTEIWTVSEHAVTDLVRRADHRDAEAIVVSCTNVPTYDVLARLEAELGKPVVSANQVTMWAALLRAGHRPVGPGQRLLDRR